MKFGKYKIDEFYLLLILIFIALSLFAPSIIITVAILIILGLEKEEWYIKGECGMGNS